MQDIPRDTLIKAGGGDIEACEVIYKAASGFVYNVAFRVTGNREDAEEVAQDAFLKVFRGLKDFRFSSSFSTWLYRITVNSALNVCRRRSRYKEVPADQGIIEDAGQAARGPDPSVKAMDEEDASRLVSGLLNKLSPEHRSCIVLREIEGLDYKEMADILRIPLNTVRSRLKRAREALIACCRNGGVSYEV